MQRCGNKAAVFIEGKWVWFESVAEAAETEARLLMEKIQHAQERGMPIILTPAMVQICRAGKEMPDD